jgi:two-component system response regulator DesR
MCVDDNELVAEAVKRRIAYEPRFEWAGWAANTNGLLESVVKAQPDVVLFDIDMPGRDPFTVVRELAQAVPTARAVMFSGYVRGDYIDRAIEAGAWGYVSKNASIDEVLTSVEQVAVGEFALTQEAAEEQRRRPGAASTQPEGVDDAFAVEGG